MKKNKKKNVYSFYERVRSKVLERLQTLGGDLWHFLPVLLVVLVKVLGVTVVVDLGHDGRLQFFERHLFPVDKLEPLVALDVVGAVLHAAEAFGAIGREQLLDEVFGVQVDAAWPLDFTCEYLLVDLKGILVVERRLQFK